LRNARASPTPVICAPLPGAQVPGVPKAEADHIAVAARANGVDVTYMVFDEGHSLINRDNDIKANTTIVDFLAKHLNA
jgi:dipeptidyl aminopeptidase/acylaminoacyl peptidase